MYNFGQFCVYIVIHTYVCIYIYRYVSTFTELLYRGSQAYRFSQKHRSPCTHHRHPTAQVELLAITTLILGWIQYRFQLNNGTFLPTCLLQKWSFSWVWLDVFPKWPCDMSHQNGWCSGNGGLWIHHRQRHLAWHWCGGEPRGRWVARSAEVAYLEVFRSTMSYRGFSMQTVLTHRNLERSGVKILQDLLINAEPWIIAKPGITLWDGKMKLWLVTFWSNCKHLQAWTLDVENNPQFYFRFLLVLGESTHFAGLCPKILIANSMIPERATLLSLAFGHEQ